VNARRPGPIIAAAWLIGLGVVLLVRDALDLTWSTGWPLILVLVGAVTAVSTAVRGGRATRGAAALWTFTWPVAWIVAGLLLLASTTGRLERGPLETLDAAWPWAAIALGMWFVLGGVLPLRAPAVEAFQRPLGALADAGVRVRFGGGALTVRPAAPGRLVDGTFRGGVTWREPRAGRIELEQDTSMGVPWLDHEADWDLGVTAEVPLDLRVDCGASRSVLDLTELRLRSLELHSGASQTRVRLPRSAGATAVRAETGAAELIVEVPAGVAVRVRSRMALGATSVDEARFPRTAAGTYESPDYATAANRVDLDLQGGVGAVRIVAAATPLAA
jgi:hypothetical protein